VRGFDRSCLTPTGPRNVGSDFDSTRCAGTGVSPCPAVTRQRNLCRSIAMLFPGSRSTMAARFRSSGLARLLCSRIGSPATPTPRPLAGSFARRWRPDTATLTPQSYGTERGVGRGIAESGIARDELYIASKLANDNHAPDDVRRSVDQTLANLGVDQLDLFLIHWPLPMLYGGDYVSTWTTLTELVAEGRLRSAGVSNFQPAHLDRLVAETGIAPIVNQFELHPYSPTPTRVRRLAGTESPLRPIARSATTGNPLPTRRSPASPRRTASPRPRSSSAGTSNAATLPSRNRPGPNGCARTSPSSTSNSPRRRWRRSTLWTEAPTAVSDPTPTPTRDDRRP
jgi:Aldo/keto reductase family